MLSSFPLLSSILNMLFPQQPVRMINKHLKIFKYLMNLNTLDVICRLDARIIPPLANGSRYKLALESF